MTLRPTTHRSSTRQGRVSVLLLAGLCWCVLAVSMTISAAAAPPDFSMLVDLQPRTPNTIRAEILYFSGRTPSTLDLARDDLFLPPRSDEYDEPESPIDPWLSFDKFQHVTLSFFFTVGWQYGLENKLGWSRNDALPVSVGSTLVIGLGKEVYDWQVGPRRFFSVRDLVANGLGTGLAAVLILI